MTKDFLLTSIIAGLIFGLFSAFLAKKRQKDPFWWFSMGFIFGILAPIFLIVISSKRKTRPIKSTPVIPSHSPDHEELKVLWYYLGIGHKQEGPVTIQGLIQAFKEGKIQETSYVWNEQMDNWQKLSQLPIKEKITSSL